ncbi:hypothetical protein RHGRI_034770 [Rhododendron griersonianum]|uniref:Clp ATPase C-terminal domain-containing protein n=1 Tax=Rhododendron griersonianum TaxID=479676 RepID=A0AAV6I4S4_9ERIC|nr:hypothetical protein RHGRI_034770 [Rhododendron griersonianum]
MVPLPWCLSFPDRRIYGGSKRNGSRPPHFCKSSGSVARHILQQLQNMNIVDFYAKGSPTNSLEWHFVIAILYFADRLTDGQGRTVDFTNTVIILTSNLGAEYLLKGLTGKCTMERAKEMVMKEVRKHFKPELLNRLDEIVIFDPLTHEQLRQVARLQLKDIAIRLAERGIALAVTEAALDVILAESYDPLFSSLPDVVPNGKDLVYRVEKDGGLVNAATRQKSDILIQIPNDAKSDAAQSVKKMKIEKVDEDDEMEG